MSGCVLTPRRRWASNFSCIPRAPWRKKFSICRSPPPTPPGRGGSISGPPSGPDRKSTRLNSSHTEIYTLSLHDALPIFVHPPRTLAKEVFNLSFPAANASWSRRLYLGPTIRPRSEEHTSELQSHRDLHSFPTRRSSDLRASPAHPGERSFQSVVPRRQRLLVEAALSRAHHPA